MCNHKDLPLAKTSKKTTKQASKKVTINISPAHREKLGELIENKKGLTVGGVVEGLIDYLYENERLMPLLLNHVEDIDIRDVMVRKLLDELRSRGSPESPKSEGEATRKSASNAAG